MWKLFAYEKTIGHGRKTLVKKKQQQKKGKQAQRRKTVYHSVTTQ